MPEQNDVPQQHQESVAYVNPHNSGTGNSVWQAIKSSKLLKIGLPLLLVALMPVVIFLSQQRQENQSHASAATTLSFSPESKASSPLSQPTGSEFVLYISLDPGTNLVSTVRLDISYDPTKLTLDEKGFSLVPDVMDRVIAGPVITPGNVQATVVTGPDPTKAINNKTNIAMLKFRTIAPTDGSAPTLVKFNTASSAFSIGSQDQYGENVLATTVPAAIQISGQPVSITPSQTGKVDISGQYVDKDGKPLTLSGAQVTLYKQGSKAGTINKGQPTWSFSNLKKGKYRIEAKFVEGYTLWMVVCEGACNQKDEKKYTRDYSRNFEVIPHKITHVKVKYISNSTATQAVTPTISSGASPTEAPVCSPTTADLNKDGRVDNADGTIIANCYNKSASVPGCQNADIDKSGKVDLQDLNCVLRGGH